jgi:hypothetical protein
VSRVNVSLVNDDCLAWMRAQPSNSVDLVFGSPPYEAARTYGIDFKLKGQAWVDWMVERIVEAVRISRGLVAMVVEGQTRKFRWSAAPVLLMADLHRAGIHLRKPPAFARVGIPGSGGPDWLRNDYEFIVCCTSGGKLPWSDNTAMGHPPKWAPGGEMSNRSVDGSRVNGRDLYGFTPHDGEPSPTERANGKRRKKAKYNQWGHSMESPTETARGATGKRNNKKNRPSHKEATRPVVHNGRAVSRTRLNTEPDGSQREQGYTVPVLANPGNVIECVVGGGVMGSHRCHENEAPFPEKLAEFFIRSFCPPGGTVADIFCGSGTVPKVASMCGRNSIGVDIRASQIELTARRLREECPMFAEVRVA